MASMISRERGLLFVHIPKTAGCSITYTYADYFDDPYAAGVPGAHSRATNAFERYRLHDSSFSINCRRHPPAFRLLKQGADRSVFVNPSNRLAHQV